MNPARLYKNDLVEFASRSPAPALRRCVERYTAWFDGSRSLARRRHLPSGSIPLIINFDAPVRLLSGGESIEQRAFAAGLHDVFVISESAGPNLGVQVDFTAYGARRFFGRPLDELANCSAAAGDLLGVSVAERLASRLFDAVTWDDRFEILDREIAARVARARPVAAEIEWTWERLLRCSGGARIADLQRATGWSERHFAASFRHELGLTPKAFARVLRFRRAAEHLSRAGGGSLADLALSCGYYDQAHFNREFARFAGVTPHHLLARRSPPVPGFSA